tara:strand:- start:875 stop:1423 length:549 start_codon:yes stop_codon:yes gene_type:complete
MIKWIKEQLNYRAKYKALLNSKDEASKNALMVMGQYEHLCANLPYEHELSTKRHWEEHADARLWKEHKVQTRALNALRETHCSLVELWRENVNKYGYAMYAEWQPIEVAPKDGTVVLGFANNEDGTVFLSEIMWCKKNETIIGVTGSEAGPNQWFSLLLSGSVCPTHWMPLPEPPTLGEKER